ncbi:hypothetical protein GFL89_25480 [Rhizobium leguminosarum bv. viciae]|nr:hypothetical protein [Rhizobium leguminosarum bv. viciae]
MLGLEPSIHHAPISSRGMDPRLKAEEVRLAFSPNSPSPTEANRVGCFLRPAPSLDHSLRNARLETEIEF